jgi:hypothetical protein
MAESQILNRTEYKTKYAGVTAFYYSREVESSRAQRHIRSLAKLMDKYSHPTVTKAVGKQLEGLVKYELRVQGFEIVGENTQEYKGRAWAETSHNLDFIAEHKSGRLTLGVEVKNTLSVMPRNEIDVKIRMCHFLGIKPVFAVRWVKSHVKEINSRGGFAWMFKTQIYPPGYEDLVNEIFKRMGLPVSVRTDLPPKTIPPFQRWIEEHLK